VTDSSVPGAANDQPELPAPASSQDRTDRFAQAPISRLVGFQVQPPECPGADGSDVQLGQAVVLLECTRHHHNPMGRVHGGLIAALADAAMGIAFGRTLLPGEDFSTVDMQISFLRPIKTGLVRAEAKVIERGLRIGFVRCEISNARGKLVAVANCTCTLIRT
jgi:uncharacterized protein (TIGR00369 family)